MAQAEPTSPLVWSEKGRLLLRNGDLPAVRAALTRAVELAPLGPGALISLGDLELRQGDLAAAEVHYRRALVCAPTPTAASSCSPSPGRGPASPPKPSPWPWTPRAAGRTTSRRSCWQPCSWPRPASAYRPPPMPPPRDCGRTTPPSPAPARPRCAERRQLYTRREPPSRSAPQYAFIRVTLKHTSRRLYGRLSSLKSVSVTKRRPPG
jgi:hypothetical protein